MDDLEQLAATYDPAVYRPGPVPGTLVCVLDANVVAEDLVDQHDTTHGLPAYLPGASGPAAAETTPAPVILPDDAPWHIRNQM